MKPLHRDKNPETDEQHPSLNYWLFYKDWEKLNGP